MTWRRSAVSLSFLLRLAACRMRSRAGDASARPCVRNALCGIAFPAVPALGSIGSEPDRSASFVDFTAAMAESDFSRPFVVGYGSSPSRRDPAARTPRMGERSPGSRAKSLRACQGLRPRRAEQRLATSLLPMSPSAVTKASAPETITFRGSMAGLCVPLPTLRPGPRGPVTHGSGPMRIAAPSSQRTFTAYSSPVSRRTVAVTQRAEALLKLQLSTREQSGSRQQSHGAPPTADCGRSRQRDARGEQ